MRGTESWGRWKEREKYFYGVKLDTTVEKSKESKNGFRVWFNIVSRQKYFNEFDDTLTLNYNTFDKWYTKAV